MLLPHSAALLAVAAMAFAQPPGGTTLSQPAARFTRSDKPYAILKRGPIEIVVVTNDAVDDTVLPSHRAGYSGVAVLRHKHRAENLFVPGIAGLNFEHIPDGTAHADRKTQFEPRNWPMELRLINRHAVELCQTPTFYHALESCQRYELLRDGTIQLTIEVSARKASFRRGYVGLFWASYIHKPESLDIHFRGVPAAQPDPRQSRWIRGVTPAHGVLSTHPALDDSRVFPHDEPFPLTLVHRFATAPYMGHLSFFFGCNAKFFRIFSSSRTSSIVSLPASAN